MHYFLAVSEQLPHEAGYDAYMCGYGKSVETILQAFGNNGMITDYDYVRFVNNVSTCIVHLAVDICFMTIILIKLCGNNTNYMTRCLPLTGGSTGVGLMRLIA